MRTCVLVALGCAFWSLPLAFLLTLTLHDGTWENGYGFNYEGRGFSYDLLVLFAIPLLMLGWTMSLGWLSGRGRLTATLTVAYSVVAVLAGFSWCAWLILIQV